MNNEIQDKFAVPRFCVNGCGETVIASQPTEDELVSLRIRFPDSKKFWHVKCTKCGDQRFIGELN